MKATVVRYLLAFLLSAAAGAQAQDKLVTEFSLPELRKHKVKEEYIITLPDKTTALKVENPGPAALQSTVLTIENPGIKAEFYKLQGEVRYDDVQGDGFLEMWSHFGEAAYFSRTMGDVGPMAKLKGTSDWRPFILPFNAKGATGAVTKLVVNVNLPGKGTVYLRGLKLQEAAKSAAAFGQGSGSGEASNWWSNRTAGLIGGIGGGILGCLGGALEWCAARGKSRTFVVVGTRMLIGAGVALLVLGAVAAALRQPYAVWYALLLPGVLCVLIFPFRLHRYQEQYQRLELRKIAAMDAA